MVADEQSNPDFEHWLNLCFTNAKDTPFWIQENSCSDQADDLSGIALTEYLARLFDNSGSLTTRFSREQLADGIWWICGCESSCFHDAVAKSIPIDARRRWLTAIRTLYTDLLDPLCEQFSFAELDSDPLCRAAYMLWDMNSLEGATDYSELRDECLHVLQTALDCRSAACIVSGLHGLGHWIGRADRQFAAQLRQRIDTLLRRRNDLSPDLINYAQSARTGCIL